MITTLTRRLVVTGLAAALIAQPAIAGQRPAPSFRAAVDLVSLNVTVTTGRHQFVGGIDQPDFVIFEDGVRQDVSFYSAERIPLDLAIVLDASSSMAHHMGTAQRAAISFIEALTPADRVMVVQIQNRANILSPLSADRNGAIEAIRRTTAEGATALYNGLYMTMRELMKQRRDPLEARRQAIAVLSDGDDTVSVLNYDDAMDLAKDAGIAFYTISLVAPSDLQVLAIGRKTGSQPQFIMRSFAESTGGRAFVASDAGQLEGIYATIADELANQYVLGYVPGNARRDGAFRRIVVRVLNRPDLFVRTRSGYRAPLPGSVNALRQR